MPLKSGLSHGLSSLLAIYITAFLSANSKLLGQLTVEIGRIANSVMEISLSPHFVGLVIIMSILTFLYGIVYHIFRHGNQQVSGSSERNYI